MSIESGNTTINLNNVIKSCLCLEEYFILYCLYEGNKSLLEQYTLKCIKMDIARFDNLFKQGYIKEFDIKNIIYDNLKLTNKAIELFDKSKSFDEYFKELKKVYPSKVKVNRGYRRLHQDLPRCEKLYKTILADGTVDHSLILKCINLYKLELERTNKLEFMQMLSTFLQQRNYEVYIDEAKMTSLEDGINNDIEYTNLEAI